MNGLGLRCEDYGTHSLRRKKASIIYKATGNLHAIQILLGHTKIDSQSATSAVMSRTAATFASELTAHRPND